METRFKIIISNNNLYKEIEISPEDKELTIGTRVECVVRLRKEMFFEPIELRLMKKDDEWNIVCADNLYISVGDVRKLVMKSLVHGDFLEIKYQNSDNTAFYMDFLIDFEDGKRKYERRISVANFKSISIGATPLSNIRISSPYVYKDNIQLINENQYLMLNITDTTYGVYHNGNKAGNGEQIKNGDFFSLGDFFYYYKNGELWTEIRDDMVVNGVNYADCAELGTYPKFNRNTRIKTHINDEKIEVLDPPNKREKPKNNLFMRLLPSLGMIIATVVMGSMGGTMIIFSAISGVMAIITAVVGVIQDKKDYKKAIADRITIYNRYVAKKREEIEGYRKEEKDALEEMYISQQAEKEKIYRFSSDLFERNREDEDFLCVRFGNGNIEAKREIDYKKKDKLEDEDELQVIPEQLYIEYKYIADAPVICDFKKCNAIGIVGAEAYRYQMLKNTVLDIIARQYFSDVKLIFVAEQSHKEQVSRMRILPHVYNETLKIRNIVTDDESRNIIFEYLYKELTIREQSKRYDCHMIIFFYDEYGFKSHPISKFVDRAREIGVTFVFFGQTKENIPSGCNYIVQLRSEKNATLINAENKFLNADFIYSVVDDDEMKRIINILAPVYTEEISLEGTLTKNISMFDLLNIIAVDDLNLAERWADSQVFKSMAAPIGISKSGVVSLDLHDKAHGPHGLVAGTTGSGKSELLQTYILAMATLFHPYEVAFVIIDFKGGGMVNQFKKLPHLLGAITNIDGKEINRSLKSIKAELQKRQRLFAEADVNHIDRYIRKYKTGEVKTPLPHLIIIVDEFAELKAEQPEFMKELISAARIGRSLGVHLILATQKPSGQVNEQIWSNSRFKLCLKVQSQEDSNEVIKSPLAAEIKEPGRAYLQVGNNEIFELFQSAYSGAAEKAEQGNVKEFTIYNLTDSGKRVPVYVQKKRSNDEGNVTQLDSIVKYVSGYCEDNNIEKLPDICLPALEKEIAFEAKKGLSEISVCVGIYDAPDRQYQGEIYLNLAETNLAVIGSSQTGKTNLLQVIIRGLASQFSPSDVNIYIADFGTMLLKNYEGLRHVGGVVCANDTEKINNMFKLLHEEMAARKEILVNAGVSSFVSYREAGHRDMPLIVLLVDNLTLLRELYLMDVDSLLPICREGLSVGISVVVTNSQTNGIGYKYMANFDTKMALYCNDSTDYTTFMGRSEVRPDNIPGRCIVEIDKEILEAQLYLAFEGEKEYQRVEKISRFIADVNNKYNQKARQIPVIPDILTTKSLMRMVSEKVKEWCIGLDYATVSATYLNLSRMHTLGVVAQNMAEIQNILDNCIYTGLNNAEIYLADNMSLVLKKYKNEPQIKDYTRLTDKYSGIVNEVYERVKGRYELTMRDEVAQDKGQSLIVLIAHGQDFVDTVSADRTALEQFRQIITKYKNMKVCVILTGIENARIPMMGADVLKVIRDNGNFIIMEDLHNFKLFDITPSLIKKFKEERKEHDGYLIENNEMRKIKIARYVQ